MLDMFDIASAIAFSNSCLFVYFSSFSTAFSSCSTALGYFFAAFNYFPAAFNFDHFPTVSNYGYFHLDCFSVASAGVSTAVKPVEQAFAAAKYIP